MVIFRDPNIKKKVWLKNISIAYEKCHKLFKKTSQLNDM